MMMLFRHFFPRGGWNETWGNFSHLLLMPRFYWPKFDNFCVSFTILNWVVIATTSLTFSGWRQNHNIFPGAIKFSPSSGVLKLLNKHNVKFSSDMKSYKKQGGCEDFVARHVTQHASETSSQSHAALKIVNKNIHTMTATLWRMTETLKAAS